LAAPPMVSCDTDANIFNTGYDAATGTILGHGAKDANWEVAGRFEQTNPASKTSLPPSNATWGAANVGNLAFRGMDDQSLRQRPVDLARDTPEARERHRGLVLPVPVHDRSCS
jgi:hypothetical protein